MAFCTRCGTHYRGDGLVKTAAGPRHRADADGQFRLRLPLALAGAVLLAAAGAGTWTGLGRGGAQADAGSPPATAGGADPGAPGSAAGRAGPAGGGSAVPPGATELASRPVRVTAAAAGSAAAAAVTAFLGDYFAAINRHDYQAYQALRSARAGTVTRAQFSAGYGSTTDTGATLHAVAPAAGGDLVAQVTFDSRQDPARSATGSACTAWRVALYLERDGGGYRLDNPPPGYRARAAPCR